MNKNFKLFLISSASTLLGIEIFHLAIPLTILSLGYSAVDTGWVTFFFFLPVLFLKILISPMVEKRDKKRILLISELARLLLVSAFAIALFLFKNNSIYFILSISFLFGIATTLTDITEPSALKSLLIGKDATSILSKYEVRTRSVQLIAPTLCGLLISWALPYPYLLAIFISALSFLLLLKVNLVTEKKDGMIFSSFWVRLHEGFIWLKSHRLFMIMVMLTAINNFLHPVLYLTIIYKLTTTDVGFNIVGYILSGLGVGGIIGSLIAQPLSKRINFHHTVIFINIFRIFVFLGFFLFPYSWGYFIFFVLKAILGGLWSVCYNVYTINAMPHNYVARISALSGFLIKVFTAAGGLCSGYAIQYLGINITLLSLVVLTVLMFICTLSVAKYK